MPHTSTAWRRVASGHWGLTSFLVLSLAVALAGGAVALSLNSAVFWRALPFDAAGQLLIIEARGADGQPRWLSWRELESIAAPAATPFDAIAGFTVADFIARSEPGLPPEPLLATLVSPDFFRVFRIQPAQGELPASSTYGASADRVVLLGHELWQRRYGGAPDIVGRSVRLSRPEYLGGTDEAYRVIGILPRQTWLFWKRADIVLPLQASLAQLSDPKGGLIERVVGRLDPGSRLTAARAASPALLERIRTVGGPNPTALIVADLQDALFADLRPLLLVALSLALGVLLLAGANVALAIAAQAFDDRRDTAIRLAIGASYRRLFRDGLPRHAIMALVAAGLGVLIARPLIGGIGSQIPWLARIPGEASAFRLDAYVLLCLAAAVAGVTIVSSGAVHAVARRLRPWPLLSSAAAEDAPGAQGSRSFFVGAEIALCSATVITASALVAQLTTLRAVDLGVDETRSSALWINLGAEHATPIARAAYYERLVRAAQALSGIESIGGIDLPFTFDWQAVGVRDDSRGRVDEIRPLARAATPGYRQASGITLLDGGWIADSDRAGAPPVVVVSESLARARWPNDRAVGQRLRTVADGIPSAPAMVVGVVTDTRHAPHEPPDKIVYRAVAQEPPPWLYLIARARPGVVDPVDALNAAIWRVNPDQPIDGPWPIAKWRDDQTRSLRFLAALASVLAATGAVLSAAALYGLTTWWVAASRRSLGIRRAVGAKNTQIAWWFAAQWGRVVLPGIAAGWVLQLLWMRLLTSTIEGLGAPSVTAVAVAVGVIALTAAVAAGAPLKRALETDSSVLMR